MRVQAAPRRSSWHEGRSGREVVIPARRNSTLLVVLPLWLSLWSAGMVGAAGEVASGRAHGGEVDFLELWIAGAVLAGSFAVYSWLWTAIGRERVGVASGVLRVRREVAGLGITREYALADVRNFRVCPDPTGLAPWAAGLRPGRAGAGVIAFDYGARTIRFADGIEEAEASLVVDELGVGSGIVRPAA